MVTVAPSGSLPMSEREPDFEFDFFEEPETQEASARERTLRRPLGGPRGPRGPRRPRGPMRPAAGFVPLARLVGLIAFAILIVVLLVLWVQDCQGAKQRDAYEDYMADMAEVARASDRVGRELSDVLTTPGIKPAELETQLKGLVQQQDIGIAEAEKLDPPGPLVAAHSHALDALELRSDGLAGLAEAFRQTRGSTDASAAGLKLSSQADRLVAGDVIWDDLFKTPAATYLNAEDLKGIPVPDSNFVQTRDLASTRSMVPIWERINGSAASGGGVAPGLHGTGIESVRTLPDGKTLSESTENAIEASTDLKFEVAVANTGDNQEVRIEVTLTIQQSPTPIVKKQTIQVLNVGETETVVFSDFPSVDFGEKRTLRIDVEPVPKEKNTTNNSAEYPVIFSLGA